MSSQEDKKPSKEVVIDDGQMIEYIRNLLKDAPGVEEDENKP